MSVDGNRSLFFRKYLLFLYFFFNFVCCIYFCSISALGGDFSYDFTAEPDVLIIALLTTLSAFVLLQLIIIPCMETIPCKAFSVSNEHSSKCAMWIVDIFVFFVGVLSLYSAVVYKVGVLGVNSYIEISAPKYLFYFNSFIQPIYFILIYLFSFGCLPKFSFWQKLNAVIYVVLLLACGQTGFLLLIFLLFIGRQILNGKKIRTLKIFTLTIICLLIYPFIRLLKNIIVGSVNDDYQLLSLLGASSGDDYVQLYFSYFIVSMERFQSVANTYFIIVNGELINSYLWLYNKSASFFTGYWLFEFISSVFVRGNNFDPAQEVMAMAINGRDNWSSQIGFWGYAYFYGFSSIGIYMFVILLIWANSYLSRFFWGGNKMPSDLCWAMSLILLCHGWFIPYFNFTQAMIIYSTFVIFVFGLHVFFERLFKVGRCRTHDAEKKNCFGVSNPITTQV